MDTQNDSSHGIQRLFEIVQGLCWIGLVILPAVGVIYAVFAPNQENPASVNMPAQAGAEQASIDRPTIRELYVSRDGQYLNVATSDRAWTCLDAHTGRNLAQRRMIDRQLHSLTIRSPDGLSAGIDQGSELRIFNEQGIVWQGRLSGQLPSESIQSCSICVKPNLIAAVSDQGALWLLDVERNAVSLRNSVQFERPMSKVALSPAGDRIAIITENRQMLIWEAASERVAWEMDADSACTSATWSGDGQRLMTFGWEGWVTVWQADSGQVIHRWRIDSQIFPAAKLSSDGRLAAVSEVSRIRIWDVETGQVHSEIPGHDDVISALVFADEDRALFFGDLKGRLQRWSVTDQREVWAVP